jgi:hypothetical protein
MKIGLAAHRFCVLALLLIILSLSLAAQTEITSMEEWLEDLTSELETEVDDYSLMEDLTYFLENPISINQTDEETLGRLHFLTDFQIKSLLVYVHDHGSIVSPYEIPYIYGFDQDLTEKLLPFIRFDNEPVTSLSSWGESFVHSHGYFLLRAGRILETAEGSKDKSDSLMLADPNAVFLGAPWKRFVRIGFSAGNRLSVHLLAENDAGEPFMTSYNNRGFDFYSANAIIHGKGFFKYAVIGDFRMQVGQGLTCWTGSGFRKSASVQNVCKRPQGLSPYTSSDENRFFRGAGMVLGTKNIEITSYFSRKQVDASLVEADSSMAISSLLTSGWHTTPAEFLHKNAVVETSFGGHVEWKHPAFSFGVTGMKYQYDLPFLEKDEPQYVDGYVRDYNGFFGIDYKLSPGLAANRSHGMLLFGELATSGQGATAFLQGMEWTITPLVVLHTLYRNFSARYHNIYSQAFEEGTRVNNEKGLYIGASLHPFAHIYIKCYTDVYHFPWLRYDADAPSGGREQLMRLEYSPGNIMQLILQARHEVKGINFYSEEDKMNHLVQQAKSSVRLQADFQLTGSINSRSRLELSRVRGEEQSHENGFLVYQELSYSPPQNTLSIRFRYCLFDTDGFDSRIYSYEQDMASSFSIPAFQGKGTRYYLYVMAPVLQNTELWFRWARTYYSDRSSTGSGLYQRSEPTITDLRFQLRYKF